MTRDSQSFFSITTTPLLFRIVVGHFNITWQDIESMSRFPHSSSWVCKWLTFPKRHQCLSFYRRFLRSHLSLSCCYIWYKRYQKSLVIVVSIKELVAPVYIIKARRFIGSERRFIKSHMWLLFTSLSTVAIHIIE